MLLFLSHSISAPLQFYFIYYSIYIYKTINPSHVIFHALFRIFIFERIVYQTVKEKKIITRYKVENNGSAGEKIHRGKMVWKSFFNSNFKCYATQSYNIILFYFTIYYCACIIIPHSAAVIAELGKTDEKKEKNDSLSLISN